MKVPARATVLAPLTMRTMDDPDSPRALHDHCDPGDRWIDGASW